jgi:predicted RNA-binding protein with PIN domain
MMQTIPYPKTGVVSALSSSSKPRVLVTRSPFLSVAVSFSTASTTALLGSKGDGKQRRKPTPAAVSTPTSTPPIAPQSPRVSSQINIPVRQQIKWAQLNKEIQREGATAFRQKKVERTKYRRAWEESELEVKAQERKKKGQDPNWEVILNQTLAAVAPLVIVDGYNVIYQWARLKKHMISNDPSRARQLLIDDLENLVSIKGWRIEVVFDGSQRRSSATTGPMNGDSTGGSSLMASDESNLMNKANRRIDQLPTIDVTKFGVRTVFTGMGVDADTYIERRCALAKESTGGQLQSSSGSLVVVTNDALIRLAGHSSGAYCMSSDRFVTELKAIKKAVDYRVEAAVAKANGHSMRPEKLRASMMQNPSLSLTRFGRGSVVVDDKRQRKLTHRDRRLKQEQELTSFLEKSSIQPDESAN